MLTKQEVAVRVLEVVKNQLSISDARLDSSLVDDLGSDSLDLVELVMDLEEEFNVSIPDEADKCVTVQDVVDLVHTEVNK